MRPCAKKSGACSTRISLPRATKTSRSVPYGQSDPLYERDISFYLFSLPAYVALKNWMVLTLVLSALVGSAVYWVHGDLTLDKHASAFPSVIAHGSALLGLFFAVKAWSYWLNRFLLLYGDNAVVVGAAYTDVHVELPMLSMMAASLATLDAGAGTLTAPSEFREYSGVTASESPIALSDRDLVATDTIPAVGVGNETVQPPLPPDIRDLLMSTARFAEAILLLDRRGADC